MLRTIKQFADTPLRALVYAYTAVVNIIYRLWYIILYWVGVIVSPEITGFTPGYGEVGSEVTLTGEGLHGATVTFGDVKAQVKSEPEGGLVVLVPECSPGEYSIVVASGNNKATAPGKFRILSPAAFTFRGDLIFHGGTILNSITPSSLNQKYLVLMVSLKNISIPSGATEADLAANLKSKLEKCSDFWLEASYGRTSFTYDIFPNVLPLDKKSQDYYLSKPKTIDGSGASYPVTSAGETLIVNGDDKFAATVTFPAGSKDLGDVVTVINKALKAANPDPPVFATTFESQLRLKTTKPGPSATLDLDQSSTALTMLGLDPQHNNTSPGEDAVDNRNGLVRDALVQRVKDMSDDDAKKYLSGYSGVVVVMVTNDPLMNWPRAFLDQFEVRGKFYEFSGSVGVTGVPWQALAHETGHNLGFPDLYDPAGKWPGEEIAQWDIMAGGWWDVHPSTWIKSYMTLDPKDASKIWLPDKEIVDLHPATETTPSAAEVLLAPIESPLPATNPFKASHPDVPLCHAVRIKLDANRALLVENRQKGGYSDPNFGSPKHSTELPVYAGGVVVTDAVNKFPAKQDRSNVIMASPYDNKGGNFPDALNEEVTVMQVSTTAAIKVKITEVVGDKPKVYKVRVTWEAGTWVDPYITPWDAPSSYDTPDIWVDTELDNKWDEYSHSDPSANPEVTGNPVLNGDRLRKGFPARLYARIRNGGKTPANGVNVTFKKVFPPGIGPAEGEVIDTATVNVPGNGSALAMVNWTPETKEEGHACIKVIIDPFTDELNTSNNVAQENFTDWYVAGASPFEPVGFVYQMVNPLPFRALVRMQARGLKPGWFLDVDPVEVWLDPGEKIYGFAGVRAAQGVPFEDQDSVNGRPRISLVGRVKQGCTLVPFGGISGTAHAVRKAEITGKVTLPNDNTANISAAAKTKDGPVGNTNVTVVLTGPDGNQLFIVQIKTNSGGEMNVSLPKPGGFAPGSEFTADLLLSPSPGTAPAETRLKFKFPFAPPVANFWANPESGVAPLTVQFGDNSTGEIDSRSWDFGDGGKGSGLSPTHVYTFAGSFVVTLTVSGPNGSATTQRTITVSPEGPLGGEGEF